MRRFINYLKESYVELTKKVAWPSWDKLQNSAIVVMVASAILAILVLAIDFCIKNAVTAIYTF
jgi:preprotein translocase subunit SecE